MAQSISYRLVSTDKKILRNSTYFLHDISAARVLG